MVDIGQNLLRVRVLVAQAAAKAGRDPDTVRILAVSKTFGPDHVRSAAKAGQRLFGENRVQEALDKIPQVTERKLEWHLIGHLQANKARAAVEVFDVIQSLDSERLAVRLDRICGELGKRIQVMIEVNLGEEAQKSGVGPVELPFLADCVDRLENLDLIGLMAIPPLGATPEDSRPYFHALARLRDRLNPFRAKPLTELSMGMSFDFAEAVEEGSTLVRIGTAIFGRRI